jgi:hypothetical protein
MDILTQLYGDDVVNTILRIIFEFLCYFMAGVFGALIRELAIEKNRSLARMLGSSLLAATTLMAFANLLHERISDRRLIFGIAVLLGVYLPKFSASLKSGRFLKHMLRFFSEKAYQAVNSIEEEEKKEESGGTTDE